MIMTSDFEFLFQNEGNERITPKLFTFQFQRDPRSDVSRRKLPPGYQELGFTPRICDHQLRPDHRPVQPTR